MDIENKKTIADTLSEILIKIIDVKEPKNLTSKNKEIAMVDIIKLLNLVFSKISTFKEADANKVYNDYQQFFFTAINKAKEQIKYPIIKINNNLWRVYLFTIFKNEDKGELLEKITGWSLEQFQKEKLSEDMKMICLSIIHLKDKDKKIIKNNFIVLIK